MMTLSRPATRARVLHCAMVAMAMLIALGAVHPAWALTCIQRHGPDGLPFTTDDPLRLNGTSLGGQFYLCYTATDDFNTVPFAGGSAASIADNNVYLGYIDLTHNTVSELDIMPTPATSWGAPQPIGSAGSHPPMWPAIEDYYVAGNAIAHDILVTSGQPPRDDPAVLFDPSWFVGVPPLVQQLNLGSFWVHRAHSVGLYRMVGDMNEHLSGSFKVSVQNVDVKVGVSIFGHDFSTWKSESGSAVSNANQLPADFVAAVSDQISKNPTLAAASVDPKAVIDAAIAKARPSPPVTCSTVQPSLSANPDPTLCTAIMDMVDSTHDALDKGGYLVSGNGLLQTAVDAAMNFGNWMPWMDPYGGGPAKEKVVEDVLQNKFKQAFDSFMKKEGRPIFSGSELFNSSYLYGPAKLWLIENPANGGPLVETYLNAHLNRINPYDFVDPTHVRWDQLDLIVGKVNTAAPTPVEWPPVTTGGGTNAGQDLTADGNYVLTGDEAAAGDLAGMPSKISVMLAVVHPEAGNGIRMAWTFRTFSSGTSGAYLKWKPWPASGYLPEPKDAAGNSLLNPSAPAVRHFHAHVTTKPASGITGFDFGWDFDGTGKIQSVYGNTTHYVAQGGALPVCFARDPGSDAASQRTGLAWLAALP